VRDPPAGYAERVKLYGTTTSPFVRRARAVAAEVGEPVDLVNTATDDGQAALRAVSPIWKVPVADVGGRVLYDSRTIVEWLVLTRGWGRMAPPRDRWREANLVNAIDGALESIVQVFYLARDGVAVDEIPRVVKNRERTGAILDWLGGELAPGGASFGDGLGLAELSLVCTLDWMDFRSTYPTAKHPALAPLRAAWRDRPSLAATRPHA
jgi:glutathione S-transferase